MHTSLAWGFGLSHGIAVLPLHVPCFLFFGLSFLVFTRAWNEGFDLLEHACVYT